MSFFDSLVERRILEAQAAGQFSNLPGEGAPLELDDDRLVPEELRVAYRILKNAGFVPAEVEALRELHDLETLVARQEDASEKRRLIAKMRLLMLKTPLGRRGRTMHLDDAYYPKIAEKLARGSAARASDADREGAMASS
jgi:hypothetical protein